MNIRLLLRSFLVGMGLLAILASSSNPDPVKDTEPDAFTFQEITKAPLSSEVASASITVTGIDAPTVIEVSGGSYSINSNAFTVTNGTVNNNDQVRIQHTTSSDYQATTSTTLTVGGVAGTFSSMTILEPKVFKSAVTNINLKSKATGESLVDNNAVIEGTNIIVD